MFEWWKSKLLPSVCNDYEGLVNQDDHDEVQSTPHRKSSDLIIYWVYFIYGIAMLLPWNVFITASEYFSYRFAGSAHQDDFQNYFSAYSNCTNLIALAVLLWLRQSKIVPNNISVLVPLSINLLVFLFYAITSLMTSISADFYFGVTIALMVVTGITTSMLQLTVFADASQLLPKYMQAVMSGQGIAGVSVSLFSFLTMVLGGDGRSVFFYFFSALLVTFMGVLGRFVLQQNATYQLMTRPASNSTNDIDLDLYSAEQEEENNTHRNDTVSKMNTMWNIVFKQSPGYICTVVYIYIITLALFPSITVQIKSVSGITPSIFISFHFLLFNVGDWIGRTLPIIKSFQVLSSNNLLGLSLLRTLFIPIFLNLVDNKIQSDFLFFSSVLLFAISNGWLTSLVFMAAPRDYPMTTKPLAGSIMSFSLVIGLALGGLSSFLVSNIFL